MKRILIACESSGVVRDAFTSRGFEAWSCDLLPTESPGLHYQGDALDLLEGWVPVRYQGECDPEGECHCLLTDKPTDDCPCLGPSMDEDEVEYKETEKGLFARRKESPHWDALIAHPPCTYLSSSGMHWTVRGLRDPKLTEDALELVWRFLDAPISHIAVENPVGCISTRIRPPDQKIQPYHFGNPESKTTCLWLKNLPRLERSHAQEGQLWDMPVLPVPDRGRWDNQTDSGQNKLTPSPDRWKARSKTYNGIAEAMADQWGRYLLK